MQQANSHFNTQVSETAILAVIRDIQTMQETGVVPEYAEQFWTNRNGDELEDQDQETQGREVR